MFSPLEMSHAFEQKKVSTSSNCAVGGYFELLGPKRSRTEHFWRRANRCGVIEGSF
jgi:hypothetical protein